MVCVLLYSWHVTDVSVFFYLSLRICFINKKIIEPLQVEVSK